MKLKENIKEVAKDFHEHVSPEDDEKSFLEGADFALKAVIEMLESEMTKLEDQFKMETERPFKRSLAAKIVNMDWIINQLKS